MARIAGVELKPNLQVEFAITSIYGIGRSLSRQILAKVNIDGQKKMSELSGPEIAT